MARRPEAAAPGVENAAPRTSAGSPCRVSASLALMGAIGRADTLAALADPFDASPFGERQMRRCSISFFSSAMALAGFSPLGQALVQLRIVWQR